METLFVATKHTHVMCVALSFLLFSVRVFWLNKNPSLLQQRWIKITPHAIDTLLLISGITLASLAGYFNGMPGWLILKLMLVTLYIVTGILFFKIAKLRIITGMLAFLFFFSIVYIVLHKPALAG